MHRQTQPFGRPPAPGRQRGAAAVEAGLVSLIVFVLFFGILEFGLLWRNINRHVECGT